MGEPGSVDEHEKRRHRAAKLTVALLLFVAVIYIVTFFKMPTWLPALK